MNTKALILEGGSLRALFTSGVLEILAQHGIEFDYVNGVSAGSLCGLNFVSRQAERSAQINLNYVNDPRYLNVKNLLHGKDVFNFDFMFGELSRKLMPFDSAAFNANPTRFAAIATNCITGLPKYFERDAGDDMFMACRASSSMPLAAHMVEIGGIPYLDGGVSTAVGLDGAIEEHFDRHVLVMTRQRGYRKKPVSTATAALYRVQYGKYPCLMDDLMNRPDRYNDLMDRIDRMEDSGEAFVIRPPKPVEISHIEKSTVKLQALYIEGREEAARCMPALTEYLQNVSAD